MPSRLTRSCSTAAGALLLTAALHAGAASAATAPAAAGGTSVLKLDGAAAKSLRSAGVKVSAVSPARAGKSNKMTLPVAALTTGATAAVTHKGGVQLKRGKRSIVLATPGVTVGKASRLRATIGGKTVSAFVVDGTTRKIDAAAGTVSLRGAKLRFTKAGAEAIRRALRLRKAPSGALGTLTVQARRSAPTGTGSTPSAVGQTGSGMPVPGQPSTPAPLSPAPVASDALTRARPVTAVEVTGATITWHVRESFIQYINTGEGTSVSGGATAGPPAVQPGSSTPLVYDFSFPFTGGWYDPATGQTRLTFAGTVTFAYASHNIRLTASNPEVEIAGSASRVVMRAGNIGVPAARGVLERLDPSQAAGVTHSPDGTTHTFLRVPGFIPSDAGASVFAGYYAAGAPFGWVTVELTAPPA